MDGFDGDDYIHGDVDSYRGGDPYSNVESTRDFLTQPYSSHGDHSGFNPSPYAYLGSSSHGRSSGLSLSPTHFEVAGLATAISVTTRRTGMAALDLNTQDEEWMRQ